MVSESEKQYGGRSVAKDVRRREKGTTLLSMLEQTLGRIQRLLPEAITANPGILNVWLRSFHLHNDLPFLAYTTANK